MDFRTQLRSFAARQAGMVVRGVISRINDSLATQGLQVELRFGEVADDVEHFQPFGLSFHPTKDSECVVLAVGGDQDHLIALAAMDRTNRPTDISEGEGGLYTPSGWKVFLDANDIVHLAEKSAADFVALAAKVNAELDDIRTAFDAHVHVFAATGAVSPTDAPTTKFVTGSGSVAADKTKAT